MAGPWEKYATPAADGPWAKYAQPAEQAPDPSSGGGTLSIGPFDTGIKTPEVVDRFLAGTGHAMMNVARGAQQIGSRALDVMAPNLSQLIPGQSTRAQDLQQQEVAQRKLDAPLMATTAGKVGNIVGGVATSLPAMAIPGANTVVGAGLIGGAYGLLQPTVNDKELLTNTAAGAVTGAATQWAGQKLGQFATNKIDARAAKAAEIQGANTARDAVLKEAQSAGYKVPPTAVNPNAVNTALESVSGKAATRQAMSSANAKVTNGLVAQDLGLDAKQPITPEVLAGVRAKAGQVYQQIKGIGPIQADAEFKSALQGVAQAGQDLEQAYPGIGAQANQQVQQLVAAVSKDTHNSSDLVGLSKLLRNRATANFKSSFAQGGNPELRDIATAQSKVANAVEELIQRHLDTTGNADLGAAWDTARTTIAKSYQAQAALKGGYVNAGKLAAQLDKGKPVTGGMGLAGRFAQQFEDVAKVPKSGVGVSKLGAMASLATGATTGLAAGGPAGVAAGIATAAAPYATRGVLLSRLGQNALATPNYAPGMTGNALLQMLQQAPKASIPLAAYSSQK